MSETKIIKSWGAACARQVLIIIIVFVIMLVATVSLISLSVLLPIQQSQRSTVIFSGLMFSLFLVLLGIMIWYAYAQRQRSNQLDSAFNPLGLKGKAYLWNGRQYHGTLNGRQMDVYFYRGPSLDIYLTSPTNTRLSIGLSGPLNGMAARALNQSELTIVDPDLAQLAFVSLDQEWGRQLLEVPQAKAAILQLISTRLGHGFRNLLIQPEAILLQINLLDLREVTTDNVRYWLNDLLDLARIIEALPPPSVTAAASAMERKNRMNRTEYALPVAGVTWGIFTVMAVIFVILIIFIVLTSGG